MAYGQLWGKTTLGLPYGIHGSSHEIPSLNRKINHHCPLVTVTLPPSDERFVIPCFSGKRDDKQAREEHFSRYEILLADEIFSKFNITESCAREVAADFTIQVVRAADLNHYCPLPRRRRIKTTKVFHGIIEFDLEEEFGPKPTPASREAVEYLLARNWVQHRWKREEAWCASECVICTEEIQRRTGSIEMKKCGHVFHEHCIVRWLRRSHLCPLCRDPIPTED